MATPEQLKIAREKALKSPDIGKRGKGKKTLEKEERQQIFDEQVSAEFLQIIKLARPEYKLDRFMGPIPQELIVRGSIQIDVDIAEKNKVISTKENVVASSSKDNSKG